MSPSQKFSYDVITSSLISSLHDPVSGRVKMGDSDDEVKSPVVNSILCYASTAGDSMKYDEIVRICLSFYDSDAIIEAKDLLYKIAGEESKRRRNKNRILHELHDIMDMLKKCDDESVNLRSFVADRYNSLPPSSGFEIVSHHIITLTDQISSLQKEIEFLKESRLNDVIESMLCMKIY